MKKKLTVSIFIVYLLLLIWLVLFKLATNGNMITYMRSLNLIPFGASVFVNDKIYLKEIIYNVLVFVPMGVYLSLLKNRWHFWLKVLCGFSVSLLLEIVQYIFAIGGSDITDLIVNTLGTCLGVCLFTLCKKWFKDKTIKIINSIGLIIEICAFGLLILLTIFN